MNLTDYFWLAGAGILALSTAQAAFVSADFFRRRARESRSRRLQEQMFELRIAAARKRRAAEEKKVLSWDGWRKFEVKKKVQEDATGDTFSFYLHPHDGKAIPDFMPGQYLTLKLDVKGQPKPVVRCYSLSDCAREDHYRLTIKRAMPPRDKPDAPPGVASCFLCEALPEGAIVDVKAPNGIFYLDLTREGPVVLMGGGIGITPMVAMLNAIIASGGQRETWLFYGVRNRSEEIWKEYLQQVARDHPNVRLHIVYSRPTDTDRQGVDYHHKGHVCIDLLKKLLPSNNYDFYMCGPPSMMDSLTEGLAQWGVPEARIHLESFGPSSSKKKPVEVATAAAGAPAGPEIVFRKSGKTVAWTPDFADLWELADANDVRIDAGCRVGNCGSCAVAVVSGDVKYVKEKSADVESGTCLTCCCIPSGRLELDA